MTCACVGGCAGSNAHAIRHAARLLPQQPMVVLSTAAVDTANICRGSSVPSLQVMHACFVKHQARPQSSSRVERWAVEPRAQAAAQPPAQPAAQTHVFAAASTSGDITQDFHVLLDKSWAHEPLLFQAVDPAQGGATIAMHADPQARCSFAVAFTLCY
jgi:hypothetical protein